MSNNPLFISLLATCFSLGGDYFNEPFNEYFMDPEVNNCQIEVYLMMISLLEAGYDEEELTWIIDNLDLDTYRKLTEEKKKYIQSDAKNILVLRRERFKNE
jgi:hypothetical protein